MSFNLIVSGSLLHFLVQKLNYYFFTIKLGKFFSLLEEFGNVITGTCTTNGVC